MKQRILVAVIGIPALLAVLCFAPDWATAVLVALLCVIGCHEFMAAAAPLKARRWWPFAASLSVFTVFTVYFHGDAFDGTPVSTLMPWLLAALIVVLFVAAVQAYGRDDELTFPDLCAVAVSGLIIPLALSCLVRLRMMDYGAGLVLIPLVSAFMSDAMALFGGMLFGKTKLAPRVSPKKTREGAVSGLVGALLGQLGDLSFSCVKRQCGIKDYGRLLPGHGGVLDRFDSVIFAAPVIWMLVSAVTLY